MLHWSLLQASSLLFTASLDWGDWKSLHWSCWANWSPSHSTEVARGNSLLGLPSGHHLGEAQDKFHGCLVMVPGGLTCPPSLSLSSLPSCGRAKTHGGWTQTSNTWLDPMSPCRVNNSHPLCCSQEGQLGSNFLGFDCYTRHGFLSFKCGWFRSFPWRG